MTQFIRVTALPAPNAPPDTPPSRMLINTARIEVVNERGGMVFIDFMAMPNGEPTGVAVAERFEEIADQLLPLDDELGWHAARVANGDCVADGEGQECCVEARAAGKARATTSAPETESWPWYGSLQHGKATDA